MDPLTIRAISLVRRLVEEGTWFEGVIDLRAGELDGRVLLSEAIQIIKDATLTQNREVMEANILRPLVDTLIEKQVLPSKPYTMKWYDNTLTDKQRADLIEWGVEHPESNGKKEKG